MALLGVSKQFQKLTCINKDLWASHTTFSPHATMNCPYTIHLCSASQHDLFAIVLENHICLNKTNHKIWQNWNSQAKAYHLAIGHLQVANAWNATHHVLLVPLTMMPEIGLPTFKLTRPATTVSYHIFSSEVSTSMLI
jgi:hypothetical protein